MNLVFSGSGVRYPAHIGAYMYLDRVQGLKPTAIAAQSGGAIVAAAIASGMGSNEIYRTFRSYRVSKLIDWRPSSIGLIKGGKLLKEFKKNFPQKMGDLKIPLYVGAVDAETRESVFFSSIDTPEVYTYDAVRASMSIPVVFHLHQIGQRLYMDGGVGNNMPIDLFPKNNVTGIRIVSINEGRAYDLRTKNPFKRAKNMLFSTVDSLMDASDRRYTSIYNENIADLKINYGTVDFGITENDFDIMVGEGYRQMESWWVNKNSLLATL